MDSVKSVTVEEFVQLEYKWKDDILAKSLTILSDKLADKLGATIDVDRDALRMSAKGIIQKKEPFTILCVSGGNSTVPIAEEAQETYEIIQEDRFLLRYAPTTYPPLSNKKEEAKLYVRCYETFIKDYPNLAEGEKWQMLEVESEQELLESIRNHVVRYKQFCVRHIILLGHGSGDEQDGFYWLEPENGRRIPVSLNNVIKYLEKVHNENLMEGLEQATKTVLFFCMCYGHCHCDAEHPATQIVSFTTDAKPDILVISDKCFDLEKYAKQAREKMYQIVSGGQDSDSSMDVSPATVN